MTNAVQDQTTLTIPVDSEHGGIRLVIVLVFFGSWALGYLLLAALIPNTGVNIIAPLGGFFLALLIMALVNTALKRFWPSGRALQADQNGVRLVKNGQTEQQIMADQHANTLAWRFEIRRTSRVPKGWYVVAHALEQDERYIPVYTFVSPTDYKKLNFGDLFTPLQSQKDQKKPDTRTRDDLLLAGEQRRLAQAEQHRWAAGAEVTLENFTLYLDYLRKHHTEWIQK